MPFAIDEEKLSDPSMQIMDPAKPPLKQIAFQPFPAMLYLHPKDKTKEHITKVVHDEAEKRSALAQGWRVEPHIPQIIGTELPAGFEADIPEVAEAVAERRGPGRPPKVEHAA